MCWLALTTGVARCETPTEGTSFFEKRIRPLLIDRCYECHSKEARKSKGGLLLDTKAGWQMGGDSGPAIIPGDPDKSLVVQAVRWRDEDTQMPPKNRLPQVEIDAIVEWVRMGAPDPRVTSTAGSFVPADPMARTNHWAYQPIRYPPRPPSSTGVSSGHGAIDRYVMEAIERKSGTAQKEASPLVLCRRLHFDLTGLPPTPEQLQAFSAAARSDRNVAVRSLVDQLLASPRFGEHWARHWLDVARFGESVTLRGFIFKPAWRYRDYVIESFNNDVPIDQFVREQIAGDLLPHETLVQHRRQMIGAMFLTLGNWNLEEQDKKQLDMDVVDEQLDTIGKAFLGQTIGCARCHDHKFDPIPTRDYYAMAGILKNSQTLKHANVSEWLEAPLPVDRDLEQGFHEQELAISALQAEIKDATEAVKSLTRTGASSQTTLSSDGVLSTTNLAGLVVDSGDAHAVGLWKHSQYSKRYIGDGYWHDDNSEKGGKTLSFAPDLARAGEYEVRLAYVPSENRGTRVPITIFHADGETQVRVNQRETPPIDGRFISLGQFRFEANGFGNVLVSNDDPTGYVTADAVQFLPLTGKPEGSRTPQSGAIARRESESAEGQQLTARKEKLKSLEEQLKQLRESGLKRPMVMALKEVEEPADLKVHVRGSVHNLGAVVRRGFLTAAWNGPAPELPVKHSGRLELANWIASSENPLTARVFVNRIWLWLFGEGLVRTPDNFGTTGDVPSHHELLDYLAWRFIEQGWSVKKLVREIVLSQSYQRDSKAPAWAVSNDPGNRLLSHAQHRRMTAEEIRDAMLAVSGRLSLEMGGQTYPAERAADYGFTFSEARRSVYVPVFRNAMPELFEVFDFAPSSMVTGRRSVSTVATQALFLMNHPFVGEQSAVAAGRLTEMASESDDERVDYAYLMTLGREPTASEKSLALAHFSRGRDDRLGSWTEFIHALFASADFRYLD